MCWKLLEQEAWSFCFAIVYTLCFCCCFHVHALDLLLPLLLLDLGILNREFQEPLTGVLDLLLSGDELPSLVFQVFKMAASNTQAELKLWVWCPLRETERQRDLDNCLHHHQLQQQAQELEDQESLLAAPASDAASVVDEQGN
jgi:hypothetical protein